MGTRDLFANYTGVWTSGHNSADYELATNFRATDGGVVSAVYWYRSSSTAGDHPSRVRLWDTSTQTAVIDVTTPPDNGSIGWQREALTTPVRLVVNREYRLGMTVPANVNIGFFLLGSLPQPASPLAFATPCRGTLQATGGGYPSATDSFAAYAVDVDFAPDNVPTTPANTSPADVSNVLAGWLSTTDGTHTDSAPLQDHATLATVNTNVSDVKDQENDWAFGLGAAAHGYYADMKTLIGNIKTVTDTLPTPISQLTSIVLDHYSADIDLILAQIDSVLAGLSAQSGSLSGTGGSAVGAISGRSAFPATGWSMTAEESFTDNIAFNEPADAYVINITSYQPTQPADSTAAGLWLPRLGWWCVLNGSLASQRGFVEFEEQLLTDQGRRMPACAIQLKPGTMATVQAWVLA